MRPINRNLFIAIILAILLFQLSPALSENKIKIGVSIPLTGNASPWGVDIKNELMFANEKLSNNKFEFIFEDDACAGKEAVSVAHKLLDINKVNYVLGFACSGALLAPAPIYEKAKALVIATSVAAPAISQAGDYIFRTWPSDRESSRMAYQYILKKNKNLGLISEQTEFAQGFKTSFLSYNGDNKLKVVTDDYLTTDLDYRSTLLRFKSKNIDSIFINSQTERTFLAVLKQLKQMKMNIPVYGIYYPGSRWFLETAKEMAEGIIYVNVPEIDNALTDEGKKLFQEFVSIYGKPQSFDIMFATTFESFRALYEAIQSKEDPKEYLYTHSFNGVFGPWSFDKNGDIKGLSFLMYRIENGRPVVIQ
jgi:branched-chain amino acid transport system substrate-binding protein